MMCSRVEKLFVWFEVSIKFCFGDLVCVQLLMVNKLRWSVGEKGTYCWFMFDENLCRTHMSLNDKSSMLVCAHVQNPESIKSISMRKRTEKVCSFESFEQGFKSFYPGRSFSCKIWAFIKDEAFNLNSKLLKLDKRTIKAFDGFVII